MLTQEVSKPDFQAEHPTVKSRSPNPSSQLIRAHSKILADDQESLCQSSKQTSSSKLEDTDHAGRRRCKAATAYLSRARGKGLQTQNSRNDNKGRLGKISQEVEQKNGKMESRMKKDEKIRRPGGPTSKSCFLFSRKRAQNTEGRN